MLAALAWAIFGGRQLVTSVVNFVSTPLGQIVAIAGALVLTAVGSDVHARIRDHAQCETRIEARDGVWIDRERQAAERYNAFRKQRDDQVAADVNKSNEGRIALMQKLANDLSARVIDYEKQSPKVAACGVTQRTVDRRDRLLKRTK